MTLSYWDIDTWWWPYVFILVTGVIANDMWRWLGVAFGGRLKETSELFVYVKSVATALVAGVIGQLVLYPSGPLAAAPLWLRIAACATGFTAFKLARDSVLVGVLTGEAVLIGGWLALGL